MTEGHHRAGARYRVPWPRPTYKLDFGSMVTDVAKQKVEERLTSEIEQAAGRRSRGAAPRRHAGKSSAIAQDRAREGCRSAQGCQERQQPRRSEDVLKGLFGRVDDSDQRSPACIAAEPGREADRLAEAPRPPRSAVAGHPRSVPDLALRDHAAADPGRDRHSLLPALSRALSRRRRARRRPAR